MDRKRWSWFERIAAISIGEIILFLVTAAITGIIGNRATLLFVWVWGWLTAINFWPWAITFLTTVTGFVLVLVSAHHNRAILGTELHKMSTELSKMHTALDKMNLLIGLDDSLLRHLANWMCARDRESGMKLLLTDLLQDATKAFDREVHRAIIFRPDAAGEYLVAWASYQMPQETFARSIFYIGTHTDDRKRGVAGEAFLASAPRVAHIISETTAWKCDCDCYINFDQKRPFPPYHSLVSIPIIGAASSAPLPLGVVCFDSPHPTVFDHPGALSLLQIFARRIAAALLIYEQFQHPTAP